MKTDWSEGTFVRLGYDDKPPKNSALQKNVKRVKAETWKAISNMVVLEAKKLGIERGDKAGRLSAFRAGIEGTISFLKCACGLARSLWRGFAGFRAYVHASALRATCGCSRGTSWQRRPDTQLVSTTAHRTAQLTSAAAVVCATASFAAV